MRGRVARRVAAAVALIAGLAAAPAAGAVHRAGAFPLAEPQVAAADDGEAAVLWTTRPFIGLQATVGRPGGAFAPAVTLARAGSTPVAASIAMDAAGDALAVWEQSSPDVRGGSSSLGVFAAARAAGSAFAAPVQLGGPQPGTLGLPLMAMNRRGDELVVWSQDMRNVVATGRGGSAPAGAADLGVPRFEPATGTDVFDIQAVGIDQAGNATFAGTDRDGHPAVLTRSAAGVTGSLTTLDTVAVRYVFRGVALAVAPDGRAIVTWRGTDGVARIATRSTPDAAFGAPAVVPFGGPLLAMTAAIDGQGRFVLAGVANVARHAVLQVVQGAGATFGPPTSVSDPGRDVTATTSLSVAADGHAALAWLDAVNGAGPVARVALSSDGGPFSAPLTLKPATDEAQDPPTVAVDGAGRAVPAWTSVSGDVDRVLAASLSDAGIAGPTVVAQAAAPPLVQTVPPPPRIDVGVGQSVRITRAGRIRPRLACSAPAGVKCRGTLRIDRPRRGLRARLHVATVSYVLGAGSVRSVSMRVTRAARRAARHANLDCAIVAVTKNPAGGTTTSSEELFVRKSRG